MKTPTICIVCLIPGREDQAKALAAQTGLTLLYEKNDAFDLQLCLDENHVSLFDSELNTAIHVDFIKGALAHRQQFGGGRGQAIARAVGLRHGNNPSVLDVTAGLARDAYILAGLGCKVTLVEQSVILYTMVADAVQRGLADPASAAVLNNFVDLINADSIAYMHGLAPELKPDAIYIDPMYPQRKKSALVKKDMQILQRLLGKDQNAELLLSTALECAIKRVIVKRPVHADSIGGAPPDTRISSKKTRFDVYMV